MQLNSFKKLRIFLTSLSITLMHMFFEYENFGLPFSKEISLT